ncbi:MAG: DUF72 domain-containing protein, partial [Deltaproteobacteria bacterium]|nr:DUF72 domain-containing protein [Deltaproteobacteria bacterium]
TYDDWPGRFYPPQVKGTKRLEYYAQIFDTVEVNATFYRTPGPKVIESWNRRLAPDYHLVVKAPRAVTHFKKLKDCDRSLEFFLDRVLALKSLRVILWQLPPSLHRDTERLDRFLAGLPQGVRHAVEFRHASWWHETTAAVLARRQAAFVSISHPELPDRIWPTTDFLYLRFHGLGQKLYLYDYSRQELEDWAARLQPHLAGRSLYAFFNNDYEAHAPRNAALFKDLVKAAAQGTTN